MAMDFIEPILSVASQIYTLVENVKANKKRCRRVSSRVKDLAELVRSIKGQDQGQTSADVEKALRELCSTLETARTLIEKFTSANWLEHILKSNSHSDDFNCVNDRLNDAFQFLSGALQVEQGNVLYQVFELTSRQTQDEVDGREDTMELQKLLLDHMKTQQEKTEAMQREFEHLRISVEKALMSMNKPNITDEVIRMIRPDELKYEHPKEPFMTTATSEVYKGEYRGFQVVIKRYTDLINASSREVRSVFNREVDTMKRFESPNILRMFGICIQDEDGLSPQFLIIVEYCEKGSLREVLNSERKLSWPRKARMCLDAAKGLYRLHQTEEKPKVHGCINSSKFLVAEGYTVKLGGFELAKTETSLKKATNKSSRHQEIRSLCYSPPEALDDINCRYNKASEIYSFGIVLWEIATRKIPFEDCSDQQIYQKVFEEKFKEELTDDCPEPLRRLIDACRAYENFKRPSAGALVTELCNVVAQLEKE